MAKTTKKRGKIQIIMCDRLSMVQWSGSVSVFILTPEIDGGKPEGADF